MRKTNQATHNHNNITSEDWSFSAKFGFRRPSEQHTITCYGSPIRKDHETSTVNVQYCSSVKFNDLQHWQDIITSYVQLYVYSKLQRNKTNYDERFHS